MGGDYIVEEIYSDGLSRIRTPDDRRFLCLHDGRVRQLRRSDLEPAAYASMVGSLPRNPYFTQHKGFATPEDALWFVHTLTTLTSELYEKKAFLDKLSVDEAQRSDWRERGAMRSRFTAARSNRR